MIWAIAIMLMQAADPGQDVFNKTCATGYCHGTDGAQGGAPRLAARNFDAAYIEKVVRNGISGTMMPPYRDTLGAEDLKAVVAYVDKIANVAVPRRGRRATESPAAPPPSRRAAPPEANPGRALFFDAVRGVARCGTCHLVDGWGVDVAPVSAPASAAELRSIAAKRVQTANLSGEPPFPAMPAGEGQIWDLSTAPPVLRTIDSVPLAPGANWSHAGYLKPYSNAEIEQILVFLKWAMK